MSKLSIFYSPNYIVTLYYDKKLWKAVLLCFFLDLVWKGVWLDLIEQRSRASGEGDKESWGMTWISRSDVDQSCHTKSVPGVPLEAPSGSEETYFFEKLKKHI